jgi:hypothetical protein
MIILNLLRFEKSIVG